MDLVALQHHSSIMYTAYVIILMFSANSFFVAGYVPPEPHNIVQSAMDVLQTTGQHTAAASSAAMAGQGAFSIPKLISSAENQQGKLTGPISDLASKVSDQAQHFDLKSIGDITRNIDNMKNLFGASIHELRSFITKRLDDFNATLGSLDDRIASKLEGCRINVTSVNNGLRSVDGSRGARLLIF